MMLKIMLVILIASCTVGCISTQHYQADILGRWVYTDPKYEGGIQFLENGDCYRLNSDLTRGDDCQYELSRNIIYVPFGECIVNGFGESCSFWEYHYLPAENRLSFVIAQRRSKAFTPLEKLDY